MAKANSQPREVNDESIEAEPDKVLGGDDQQQTNAELRAQSGGTDRSADDPFDLRKLRVSQDFAARAGVKKVITTVTCRKPSRHEFVRVRASEDWRLETAVYEDKTNRETYLVNDQLRDELMSEIVAICLFTAITRQGDIFLWPVKLPGPDGRTNTWNESALAAARRAESRWVRISSNMNAGCYDTYEATGALTEPEWPEVTFQELIRLCFRSRLIDNIDHPVLRSLRGEV